MVVQPPIIQQVLNLSPRDCDPVNMAAVRGAADSLLPGVVEAMESAGAQTDVEVIGQLGRVRHHAGGTEVQRVGPVILHSPHPASS